MILQLIKLDGGNGGIAIFNNSFFVLCASTGPTATSAMMILSFFNSRRGVLVLNSSTLRRTILRRSTFTLLPLSMSALIGIDWPDTKPDAGIWMDAANGPDLQQKQQNVFSNSKIRGSFNVCKTRNKNKIKWDVWAMQAKFVQYIDNFKILLRITYTFRWAFWFKSNGDKTVNAILMSWSNFHGRSNVTLIVYRTWPHSPSNDDGNDVGNAHVKGYECSPDGKMISAPFFAPSK